ncbi:MAG: hypothetical protein HUU21_06950 [Polyangiaceae bacterium]|nr:hypothetical protein [Polyangiaceae bacterium]NUQ73275.1 hypothetical protein [Polyangiaceae bacterium]
MLEVTICPEKLTIRFRASGSLRGDGVHAAMAALKKAVDTFTGRSHFFLADMRGLIPMTLEDAEVLREGIAYSRKRGTILCVHLSDSATMRLQASRLAREVSPHDEMTVEVVSLDEAERVLEDAFRHLAAGGKSGIVQRIMAARGRPGAGGAH